MMDSGSSAPLAERGSRSGRRWRGAQARLATLALLATVHAASAAASTVPRPEPDLAPGIPRDPVIVTGKRMERLSDVAGAVQVLGGDGLERLGVRGQDELLSSLPGLQLNQGQPNQALPTMRGIATLTSSELLGGQQAPMGQYVDGVPLTDAAGFVGNADIAPFDLDRIDVMRGPQGALFGSASMAGAINYLLRTPDLHLTRAIVQVRVGDTAQGGRDHAAAMMVNAPLKPGVAGLRVVATERSDAGYIHNLGTGVADANGLRQRGARLAVVVAPVPGLRLTGSVLEQRVEQDDTFALSPDPTRLSTATPTASARRQSLALSRLQLDADLAPGHRLTAVGARVDKRSAFTTDVTRSTAGIGRSYGPVFGFPGLPLLPQVGSRTARPLSNRSTWYEVRIASSRPGRLGYVVGASSQRSRFDARVERIAPGGQALWGDAGVLLPADRVGALDTRSLATEQAVYVESELALSDRWSMGLGGRHHRATVDLDAELTFLGLPRQARSRVSDRGLTPTLFLKSRFDPLMVWLKAAKGYRIGGINLDLPTLTPFRSDSVWNHEAGARYDAGGGLQFDISLFQMDWKDAQVSTLLAGPVPAVGVANIGRARSRGLESSLRWRPWHTLNLGAGLAVTDARTTAGFTSASGVPVPAGTRLPGAPRWQTMLQLDWSFAGPVGSGAQAVARLGRTGGRAFDLEGRARVGAYTQLDLQLSLARGPWTGRLAVDNALDERGVRGALVFVLPGQASYVDYFVVPPRRVSLSLRYEFT